MIAKLIGADVKVTNRPKSYVIRCKTRKNLYANKRNLQKSIKIFYEKRNNYFINVVFGRTSINLYLETTD